MKWKYLKYSEAPVKIIRGEGNNFKNVVLINNNEQNNLDNNSNNNVNYNK